MKLDQSPKIEEGNGLFDQIPKQPKQGWGKFKLPIIFIIFILAYTGLLFFDNPQELFQSRGSIEGIVVDEDGTPQSLEVYLFESDNSLVSDHDGTFIFRRLLPGRYHVYIMDDASAEEFIVDLEAGELIHLGELIFHHYENDIVMEDE